jgi:hypothetical protein
MGADSIMDMGKFHGIPATGMETMGKRWVLIAKKGDFGGGTFPIVRHNTMHMGITWVVGAFIIGATGKGMR